jgi:type IV pilus assembly protein PilF
MIRSIATGLLCMAALPVLAASTSNAPPVQQPDTTHTRPGPDLEQAASFNASLAVRYLESNEVALARDKIDKALKQNPHDPIVQGAAGLVYERLQQSDKADQFFAAALRLAPEDPNAANNYAVFLCRHGKAEKGLKMFEQVARNPAYSIPENAYTNAGVCARQSGDLARADQMLRQALAINPKYPDALLQMADMSLTRDAGLAARAFLQRYLAAAAATPDALMLGIRIERKLADHEAEQGYTTRLLREFPDSGQAREIRNPSGEP